MIQHPQDVVFIINFFRSCNWIFVHLVPSSFTVTHPFTKGFLTNDEVSRVMVHPYKGLILWITSCIFCLYSFVFSKITHIQSFKVRHRKNLCYHLYESNEPKILSVKQLNGCHQIKVAFCTNQFIGFIEPWLY